MTDQELIEAAAKAAGLWRDEAEQLRRWKSTHAPRLEALEGLLRTAQAEAHAGREAVATLASERAANSALTAEVEAAVAAERERCAMLCLSRSANGNFRADTREECAALIRGEMD